MKDNNEESIPKAYEELTVAFYQQDIAWENPEANYQLVEKAFAELKNPADVLIVPETFNTGFSDNMAAMAEPPEGPTFQFALRMAKQHNALFIGTWTVKDQSKLSPGQTVVFNRLHWVRPDGTYGYYDKGHTFRVSTEASQLERGGFAPATLLTTMCLCSAPTGPAAVLQPGTRSYVPVPSRTRPM